MDETDETPAVACTLSEDRVDERGAQAQSDLVPNYLGAEERADGYTLRFEGTGDALSAVAAFVAEELQCCSFAEYRIHVAPPYEETRLTITGPDGTKAVFGEGLVDRLEAEVP